MKAIVNVSPPEEGALRFAARSLLPELPAESAEYPS